MKKTIVRTWSGNGTDEFDKAGIKAWSLLNKSIGKHNDSVFNSKYIFRYIDIEFKSGSRYYQIGWNNEANDRCKYTSVIDSIINKFDCKTIDSFLIYVELVKE